MNGDWQLVDTTPADWLNIEKQAVTWWIPVYDLMAWIHYQFSQWRWQAQTEHDNKGLLWFTLPLILILVWQIYRRTKRIRLPNKTETKANLYYSGQDSAFYQITQHLNTMGYIRQSGETLLTWLKRIEQPNFLLEIQTIIQLHQRYRFDPASLNQEEKKYLIEEVKRWLQKL